MNRKLFVFFLFLSSGVLGNVSGQQAKLDPLAVAPSTLLSQVKALKAANPKLTPAQLVEAANGLLATNGINYSILFDAATCEKLRKIRDAQKDPAAPLKLNASLQSVNSDNARLSLPPAQFRKIECENCLMELPVLELTDKDFVVLVKGQNIKFVLPANFSTNEMTLLDPVDPAKIKRKWHIPFRSTPIGVTFDESVLYVSLNDPALDDLSLAIFSEGVFQFATRAEAEDGGVGKAVEPASATTPSRTIKFNRWKNTYLVSYQPACPN